MVAAIARFLMMLTIARERFPMSWPPPGLSAPLSVPMSSVLFGSGGEGKWITVYARNGRTLIIIVVDTTNKTG